MPKKDIKWKLIKMEHRSTEVSIMAGLGHPYSRYINLWVFPCSDRNQTEIMFHLAHGKRHIYDHRERLFQRFATNLGTQKVLKSIDPY